jgi:hypothetical protein
MVSLPWAMSASKPFKTASSSPTLEGVPFGQAFVGHLGVESGEAACVAAGVDAAANRSEAPAKMTNGTVLFMTSFKDDPKRALMAPRMAARYPVEDPFTETMRSKIGSDGAIDLEEFDGRARNLDESDDHSSTGAVRREDDFLPAQGKLQIVHLERDMRDGLNQVRNRRILPIPHPLDTEWIALMVAYRDLQVGKIDFPFKASRCRNTNVIELHAAP